MRPLHCSLSYKTMNTGENFWNVYCMTTNQMRDETAKDKYKPQQGSVTTWCETMSWPFLLREILCLSEKAIVLPQTNISHMFPSVQKPNYWIDLKVSTDYENLQQYRFTLWVKVSHSQLARPFELHVKQTQRNIACDWLIFPCSKMCCQAVSDLLILSSWFNITSR